MHVFDTRIDNLSREEIEKTVDGFLEGNKFHHIATINPEFLLLAGENQMFQDTLNACDLNVADGFGLHFAFRRGGERLRGRYPGVDLMRYIFSVAEKKRLRVFLVARQDGLSTWKETVLALRQKYPKLSLSGAFAHAYAKDFSKIHSQARECDIVLCNFGAPSQELFLAGLRNDPGSIRLAMGVGGSFDYISGKIKRAPRWMRAIGLEWLYRLVQQPKRWKRIWNAAVVFPWRIY